MIDKTELARRAVACKHWRWMPGMIDIDGCRVVTTDGGLRLTNPCLDDIRYLSTESLSPDRHPGCSPVDLPRGDMPDLDDAATLGCLLALVREAWVGWTVVVTVRRGHAWVSIRGLDGPAEMWDFQGPALGGVLVAALEAAPELERPAKLDREPPMLPYTPLPGFTRPASQDTAAGPVPPGDSVEPARRDVWEKWSPPEEVAPPEALATLVGKPFVDGDDS